MQQGPCGLVVFLLREMTLALRDIGITRDVLNNHHAP